MENTDTPKYMKIAIDIAQKIYNNEFKVGGKKLEEDLLFQVNIMYLQKL